MKFVMIIGPQAVGKMTVGQELSKITGLKLFHNHMTIEPVIELFGYPQPDVIKDMRESVFKNFAKTDKYGLIFTFIWAFDEQSDWDYIKHVSDIFEEQNAEVYYIELVASQEERLKRNSTENRLNNKPSKRDINTSNQRVINEDKNYRLVSNDGEIKFNNYIKIDNTNLQPEDVVRIIKERFSI